MERLVWKIVQLKFIDLFAGVGGFYETNIFFLSILTRISDRGVDTGANIFMKNPFVNLLKKIQRMPDELQEKVLASEMDWIQNWQEWAKDEEGK